MVEVEVEAEVRLDLQSGTKNAARAQRMTLTENCLHYAMFHGAEIIQQTARARNLTNVLQGGLQLGF